MPVSHWIDEETGILWQKWAGFITAAEVVEFVRAMQEAPAAPARDSLVDISEMTGTDVTADQMSAFAHMPHTASRIAIVAPQEVRFGRARMFEMLSEGKSGSPIMVRAFRSVEGALQWLREATSTESG